MRKGYQKLSLEERERLAVERARGRSIREIAIILGRSHSTLSRELRRYNPNSDASHYSPCVSHEIAEIKRSYSGRRRSFAKNGFLADYVRDCLSKGWSPELISGRMKAEYPDLAVSHETIYQYVYDNGVELAGYLPRRHIMRKAKRKYRKHRASQIPNRLSIDKRPAVINKRSQFGHWESDSIVSHKSSVALHVIIERKSRYVHINRVEDKTSLSLSKALISRLANYVPALRRSITYDNGTENTRHEEINQTLGTKSYFCNPYHSWEKGSVENTNGLIRRYIPKKMDLSLVRDEDIRHIEHQLNNRPKKCLDYQTPQEVLNQYLSLVQ